MAKQHQDTTIIVDGYPVAGWTDVRVTRGIERFPSDFDFTATEVYPGSRAADFMAGQTVQIKFGNTVMLTGYIDRVTTTLSAESHIYQVTGRSKCMDLIDCSAEIKDWRGTRNSTTITALAQELAKPYGITVTDLTTRGIGAQSQTPVFQSFNANLGETGFEIIERVARSVGVLVYDDADGNLVLARTLSEPQAMRGSVVIGQNIQALSFTLSMDNRYGVYTVVPQPVDNTYDRRHAANQAAGTATRFEKGEARDPGVDPARNRHLYIVGEQFERTATGQTSLAQRRADWEMNRRWGRSQAVSLIVDSWCDSEGRLWQPNTIVSVIALGTKLGMKDWVLAHVSYVRSIKTGTIAELTLMPKEAFDIQPTTISPFDIDRTSASRDAAAIVRGEAPPGVQGAQQ